VRFASDFFHVPLTTASASASSCSCGMRPSFERLNPVSASSSRKLRHAFRVSGLGLLMSHRRCQSVSRDSEIRGRVCAKSAIGATRVQRRKLEILFNFFWRASAASDWHSQRNKKRPPEVAAMAGSSKPVLLAATRHEFA